MEAKLQTVKKFLITPLDNQDLLNLLFSMDFELEETEIEELKIRFFETKKQYIELGADDLCDNEVAAIILLFLVAHLSLKDPSETNQEVINCLFFGLEYFIDHKEKSSLLILGISSIL